MRAASQPAAPAASRTAGRLTKQLGPNSRTTPGKTSALGTLTTPPPYPIHPAAS